MGWPARAIHRAGDLLFLPVMDNHWLWQRKGEIACLLYHRVSEPGSVDFLQGVGAPPIPPGELEAELLFLQRKGARFFTLADLREGRFPSADEVGVMVTFDDGFRDNYTVGLDVLDALGIQGAVFQASAMVDAASLIWEHALYWCWANPSAKARITQLAQKMAPATRALSGSALLAALREDIPAEFALSLLAEAASAWDADLAAAAREIYPRSQDLRRAAAAGHEVGSHGHHHFNRQSIDADAFERELALSRDTLTRVLGQAPVAFSYPFNRREPGDDAICARYFRQVMTVDAHRIDKTADPLSLPRFNWPGPHRNALRRRRWLLTGRI